MEGKKGKNSNILGKNDGRKPDLAVSEQMVFKFSLTTFFCFLPSYTYAYVILHKLKYFILQFKIDW